MAYPRFVIRADHVGRYAEINPALGCWMLAAGQQHATRFTTREEAESVLRDVMEELGDVWHVPSNGLRVLELHR